MDQACSGCGANLAPGAMWCPRCFAPVPAPSGVRAATAGPSWTAPPSYAPPGAQRWSPPLYAPLPPVANKHVNLGPVIGIVLGLVLALTFGRGVYSRLTFHARDLHAPANVSIYPQVTTSQLDGLISAVDAYFRAQDGVKHVAVAAYGTGTDPRFILASASGRIKVDPRLLENEADSFSALANQPTVSEELATDRSGVSVKCRTVEGRTRAEIAPLSWSTATICIHEEKGLLVEGVGLDISLDETSTLMAEANTNL